MLQLASKDYCICIYRRDCDLSAFIPLSILNNSKAKDIRQVLMHYVRVGSSQFGLPSKTASALTYKLHYLKLLAELKYFGCRSFIITLEVRTVGSYSIYYLYNITYKNCRLIKYII